MDATRTTANRSTSVPSPGIDHSMQQELALEPCLCILGLSVRQQDNLLQDSRDRFRALFLGEPPVVECICQDGGDVTFKVTSYCPVHLDIGLLARDLEAMDLKKQAAHLLAAFATSPLYADHEQATHLSACLQMLGGDAEVKLHANVIHKMAGQAQALLRYGEVADRADWESWLHTLQPDQAKASAASCSETLVARAIDEETRRYGTWLGKHAAAQRLEKMLCIAIECGDKNIAKLLVTAVEKLAQNEPKGPA